MACLNKRDVSEGHFACWRVAGGIQTNEGTAAALGNSGAAGCLFPSPRYQRPLSLSELPTPCVFPLGHPDKRPARPLLILLFALEDSLRRSRGLAETEGPWKRWLVVLAMQCESPFGGCKQSLPLLMFCLQRRGGPERLLVGSAQGGRGKGGFLEDQGSRGAAATATAAPTTGARPSGARCNCGGPYRRQFGL